MTLREQISRRLMDRWKDGYGRSWELTFEGLADEVIRLMEWARRPYWEPGGQPDLTLPPEEWKP